MMSRKGIIFILVVSIFLNYDEREISWMDEGVDGMVLIPAGEFEMGRRNNTKDEKDTDYAKDEKPKHTVYLDAFYIDIYEVTNAQYKAFIDANPEWQKDNIPDNLHDGTYLRLWNKNNYPSDKGNYPVNYISWYAAMAYAKWAGKRLPTEAEWEKAARGGLVGKLYPWGDTISAADANHGRYINDTVPVGQYARNGYGLYDMVGNVWEWCLDKYDSDFYRTSPKRNPFSGGTLTEVVNDFINIDTPRVFRGGGWATQGLFVRVDNRDAGIPMYASVFVGFRCVRDQPDE